MESALRALEFRSLRDDDDGGGTKEEKGPGAAEKDGVTLGWNGAVCDVMIRFCLGLRGYYYLLLSMAIGNGDGDGRMATVEMNLFFMTITPGFIGFMGSAVASAAGRFFRLAGGSLCVSAT